jgi:hypothetical protein
MLTGTHRIKLENEWLIPTGGGYFSPIEAIAGVLGA